MRSSFTRVLLGLVLLVFFSGKSLFSQASSVEIYKDIKKFGVLANVLYVAAHPDDENTRLISFSANHLSARTTYLSMTRGDGGQNLIGHEIRDMLGMIRTHELLEARKIDGGHQLFTRANDFGYSKTAAETFNIWNRDEVLSDVVWAIRKVKPDVIINRFNTDTLRPNHGHHTASAILAVDAFDLANDPKAFPEQLNYVDPWQPRRIFFNTSWWFYGSRENFDKADKSKMINIDIGSFDQVTGESNSEIAGRSRSMHKSQGFGSAETRGESPDYLDLIKDANGEIPKSIFDGIDVSWNRIPGGSAIGIKVDALERSFDFKDPSKSIPQLMALYKSIQALPDSYWKRIKVEECEALIKNCLGLFLEARTNKFIVSPGQELLINLEVINRSKINVVMSDVYVTGIDSILSFNELLKYNQVLLKEFPITIPEKLSIPYWLSDTPTEGLYNVSNQQKRGLPADPPPIVANAKFLIEGEPFTFEVPVSYRIIDPAEGEIYKPLSITPPVAIDFEDQFLIFNKSQERVIHMTLTAIQDSVTGFLNLKSPGSGWKIIPERIPFSLTNSGESIATSCLITAPDNLSNTTLQPIIEIGDLKFHHKAEKIDYNHLPYMSIVRDATVQLRSIDIKIMKRPIAYIQGAGDDVAGGLRQIGFDVDEIDPTQISSAFLNKYQVVILGVRAFNTIESLAYKNKILFDWVKSGGTLIVQYNVNRGLVTEEIAPFPLTLSRDRITEENSPVTILSTEHPVFRFPNKIETTDFDGWVQERGLYFPNQWDAQFTPLLEMNDTNEKPTKGALLVSPYGEGFYIYSGLSWFRHMPAGVPGAYRLLSNLIALGYKNSKS